MAALVLWRIEGGVEGHRADALSRADHRLAEAANQAGSQKPNASRATVAVRKLTANASASGIRAPIAAHFALSVSL